MQDLLPNGFLLSSDPAPSNCRSWSLLGTRETCQTTKQTKQVAKCCKCEAGFLPRHSWDRSQKGAACEDVAVKIQTDLNHVCYSACHILPHYKKNLITVFRKSERLQSGFAWARCSANWLVNRLGNTVATYARKSQIDRLSLWSAIQGTVGSGQNNYLVKKL